MDAVKNVFLGMLIAMLMVSALAVIYSKYQARILFIEIQKKEKQLDDYEVERGRLLLELSTLTEETRVEIEARQRLQLTLPAQNDIVYIRP
ncbi:MULTISPECIES: cell division protein FtsL [Methylomonas]|uniref:cell division protein FtsL n=1 Tax=Methylomonas TaxID=416 RepID=UPI0012328D1B|nr:cell division protein FtsL [Methylomonas rhizoryzae]